MFLTIVGYCNGIFYHYLLSLSIFIYLFIKIIYLILTVHSAFSLAESCALFLLRFYVTIHKEEPENQGSKYFLKGSIGQKGH